LWIRLADTALNRIFLKDFMDSHENPFVSKRRSLRFFKGLPFHIFTKLLATVSYFWLIFYLSNFVEISF
jgi:hypothetical protein